MPDYRTPLPGLFAAMLETAVNRLLDLDDDSHARFERLEGRMLQLDIEGTGITLYFAFNDGQVEVGTRSSYSPDTVISGSPVALFAMAVPDEAGNWGTPESRVTISGDANLARDMERLFSRLDPDWEGRLSRIFGDVWGHQVAAGLRAGIGQAKDSASTAGEMISEYLQQNESPVIGRDELNDFAETVEDTRDWCEELDARLNAMEEKKG